MDNLQDNVFDLLAEKFGRNDSYYAAADLATRTLHADVQPLLIKARHQ